MEFSCRFCRYDVFRCFVFCFSLSVPPSPPPLCSSEEPLGKGRHLISLRIGRVTVIFCLGGEGGLLVFSSKETDAYYEVMIDEFSGNCLKKCTCGTKACNCYGNHSVRLRHLSRQPSTYLLRQGFDWPRSKNLSFNANS